MRKLRYAAMAGALALTIAGNGLAATLVGTTDNAIGLLGLDVGGTLYDVDFYFDTYDEVYGGPADPLFEGNDAGAGAAATALQDALNYLGVSGADGATSALGLIAVVIPQSPVGGSGYVDMQHVVYNYVLPNAWAAYGVGNVYYQSTYGHNVIADFRLAAVPEPETWALMIGGLGVMGSALRFRNRRRRGVGDAL